MTMPQPLHPRVSINQLCLSGLTPADFIAAAAAIGVGTVSLCSPQLFNPHELERTNAVKAATAMDIACISHTFAIHPDLERDVGGATENLLKLIAFASDLGAPSIYLLTGGRGTLEWDVAVARFAELVGPCLQAARQQGIDLLIENASPLFADIHIAHSLGDSLLLAERSGLGLCTDLFYCWTEASLEANLARAAKRSGLVQLGDYVLGDRSLPARAVPDDGAVPLAKLIRTLLEHGYAGAFELELLGPRIDKEGHFAATTRAAQWLSRVLTQMEA